MQTLSNITKGETTQMELQIDATKLVFSVTEAAAAVGLSRSRLYELLNAGTGPRSFRVGRRHLFRVAALQEWLAKLEDEQNTSTSGDASPRG